MYINNNAAIIFELIYHENVLEKYTFSFEQDRSSKIFVYKYKIFEIICKNSFCLKNQSNIHWVLLNVW